MIGLKFKGRPPIKLAETVYDVAHLKNEYAQVIMDRNQTINDEFIGSVIAQGIMGYEGRNPKPALNENGDFVGTDLDLLSFLVPLSARGAVIEIPKYRNRRKIIKRSGERKIGTNQFGPITSLVSNKDVFSFSVRVHDKTISFKNPETEKEELGGFRSYMVVDCDGYWYDGWNRIVWDPNRSENEFLSQKGLWTGNKVLFKHYVHPNRWQSVYGAPYLLKKMLITRFNDEAGFYRQEIKRLLGLGICFPLGEKKQSRATVASGETEAIKVKTMEMNLTIPEFSGAYSPVSDSQDGLLSAYRRQKLLTYSWKPSVQFVARANELAFMRYGLDANKEKIAHWMGKRNWEAWKKTPRSAKFQRMVLSNDMALLYRLKEKTEHISAI